MKQFLLIFIIIFFSQTSFGQENGLLVDQRDGEEYKTVKIGTQVWMAENLNYDAGSGCSCYEENNRNCDQYGRLYDCETAKKVCPDGWHLPSKSEFETLLDNVGDDKKQRYLALKKDGTSGFSALFAGYRNLDNKFMSIGSYGYFWSSSQPLGDYAWYLKLYKGYKEALMDTSIKTFGRSVRCIQD